MRGRALDSPSPLGRLAMLASLAISLLCVTAALARIDLVPPSGARYGYGVSEPANWTQDDSTRPLNLFLHGALALSGSADDAGTGSCGSFDDAAELLRLNGLGKLIQLYESGDRSAASVLAAEQFLVVLPLAPATPTDGSPRYCTRCVSAVVDPPGNSSALLDVLTDVGTRHALTTTVLPSPAVRRDPAPR